MGGSSRGRGGRLTRSPAPAAHAGRARAVAARGRMLGADETAWLAAIPAAVIGVLAIALLGPPLGDALLTPDPARFWSAYQFAVLPEPREQGRFLMALAVPLLLAALTIAGVRARPRHASEAAEVLVVAVQVVAVAFVGLCLLAQHEVLGTIVPSPKLAPAVHDFFTLPTLLVATAATAGAVAAIRDARVRAAVDRWTAESRRWRIVTACLAIAAIAVWLLHAFNTEGTIASANQEVLYNNYFTLDETFAVLDGRSPLVDYAAQYGSLLPYAYAAAMSAVADSVGVWFALALGTTGLAMLALYGVLRRAAQSSIRGLLLFLPVLATSLLTLEGTPQNRETMANYFGTLPMRYAGPSFLAWLVARHLGDDRPRRAWPIFLVAGVVMLNNADAGIAALGATVAALLWSGPLSRARLGRLALEAAGGLAAALALVSALLLARAGELPDLGLLVRYAELFASSGFAQYPMPTLGLHVVIYLTYVAALGTATVRALRADPDRLLTGMLAWSAVFGLGVGAYFAGRSTPDGLPAMFLPWAFTVALLLIPAVRSIAGASWRRPPVAATACLLGFLAMACSLVQTPMPWEQVQRLQRTTRPILAEPLGQPLVAQHTRRGESVAILNLLGHRIGANLGVVNVAPYANAESMPTAEQLEETIAALRAAGGDKVFLDREIAVDHLLQALADAGFRPMDTRGRAMLLVDTAG